MAGVRERVVATTVKYLEEARDRLHYAANAAMEPDVRAARRTLSLLAGELATFISGMAVEDQRLENEERAKYEAEKGFSPLPDPGIIQMHAGEWRVRWQKVTGRDINGNPLEVSMDLEKVK